MHMIEYNETFSPTTEKLDEVKVVVGGPRYRVLFVVDENDESKATFVHVGVPFRCDQTLTANTLQSTLEAAEKAIRHLEDRGFEVDCGDAKMLC